MRKGWTLLLVCWSLCSAAMAETWPVADWQSAPPLSGPAVTALEAYAFPARDDDSRKGIRTDALLVIQDGRVVYERYAGPTRIDTPHLTWSVSKSLMATVLGVAYGEGRFQLKDPVEKFYPPFKAHPQVKLEDLLHWASGLDWQESYEYAPFESSVVNMLYGRGRTDAAAFTAAHGEFSPPGQAFRYSSGDSNVLAAALKTMVGAQRYSTYPWTALFEPLGIRSAVWETDASGQFVGSSYTYMTARDLARIGLLVQRDGRWGERQLVPKEWIDFTRQPFAGYKAGEDDAVPGAQWWLNRSMGGSAKPWPDAPEDAFAALGHWGQALYVVPSAGLVIVRYADDRDHSYQHNELLKHVLSAVRQEGQP